MIFRSREEYVIYLIICLIATNSVNFLVRSEDGKNLSCSVDKLYLTQIGEDLIGEVIDDRFGGFISLSNSGDIIAVGARYNDNSNGENSGRVRVYKRHGNQWIQLGSDIDGERAEDYSGPNALSGDGSIVAVGAIFNDGSANDDNTKQEDSGHVRVFQFDGTDDWTQMGIDIDGLNETDWFGNGLAFSNDGTVLAVGARRSGTNDEGQVRVFQWNNSNNKQWEQIGNAINGEGNNAELHVVALSDDGYILSVGEPNYSSVGRVRIFRFSNGNWEQIGKDLLGMNGGQDQFGYWIALSADGTIVTIGARGSYEGDSIGYVVTYILQNNTWLQHGNVLYGDASSDEFGNAIATSGDGKFLIVGAHRNNAHGTFSGRVQIFYFQDKWIQIFNNIDGQQDNQYLGRSVAMSKDGSTIAVGGDGSSNVNGIVKVFQINCESDTSTSNVVSKRFVDVFIDFVGAKQMSVADTRIFERITATWVDEFFASRSFDIGVQEMSTYIVVTNQTLTGNGNKVVYDQTISYIAAVDDNVDPRQYIHMPFFDLTENTKYGMALVKNLDPFADLVLPVGIPRLATNNTDEFSSRDSASSSNTALIGGIVGAIGFTLLIVGVIIYCLFKRRAGSSPQTKKTRNNPIPSDANRPDNVHERSNISSLHSSSEGNNGPTYKDQTQSTTDETRQQHFNEYIITPPATAAQQQEPPVGVLLEETLPDYKDQVRSVSIAFAEAVPCNR